MASKQETIDQLKNLLGNHVANGLLSIDETKTVAELEACISDLTPDVSSEIEEKNKKIEELESEIISLNEQLSSAEKKDSSKKTVTVDGKEYQVKFPTTVNYKGKIYKFSVAQICSDTKLEGLEKTAAQILVELKVSALKPV